MKNKVLNIVFALLLVPLAAYAESTGKRNDGFSTQLIPANGGSGPIGMDKYGRIGVTDGTNSLSMLPVSNAAAMNGMGAIPTFLRDFLSRTATTGSTTTVVQSTGALAAGLRVNDYCVGKAGTAANLGVWVPVTAVTTDSFTVGYPFPSAPANADTFECGRPTPLFGATGSGGTFKVSPFFQLDSDWQNSPITGLLKNEDSAATTLDAGVAAFTKLQSALTVDAASGDYGTLKGDDVGRLITTLATPGETWAGCSAAATGTSNTQIKAAVASNRIYVTSISCTNTSTVDSEINFKDGTGYFYTGYVNGTTKGDSNFQTTLPVPLRGSVNTALNFSMTTNATNTICCAAGYISVS